MNWRESQMTEQIVRWQDGSYDSNRLCDDCHSVDCKYPVHGRLTPTGDGYKEVTKTDYWKWCHKYGESDSTTGRIIEPLLANPADGGFDPNALD